MNKIIDINEILNDWAYRVDGGMPDPKKLSHQILLEKTLIECGWNVAERYEFIKNLQEAKSKEPPLDDAEQEKRKKLGLVWKGQGYGKENEDGITHKNSGGKLVKIDKDDKKEKEPEKKDDVPKGMIRNPNHNPYERDNEEPEFIKDPNAEEDERDDRDKVIDELTTDDGKPLNDKQKASIRQNQNTTLAYLRSDIDDPGREKGMKGKKISKETHEAHIRCADILERIWGGEEVSDEDREFLSNWVAVVEPSQGKPNMWRIYIAREPGSDGKGNFNRLRGIPADKLGGKNGFGDNKQGKAMQSWMQRNGIRTVRTSTYAGKLTTPNQIFSKDGEVRKIDKIPKENVKRREDGKVESVKLSEGLTLTRVPKKENETDRERKKRKQNNAQLEEYGSLIEKGDLEFIDMDSGLNPDTPENRKQIIQEGLEGVAQRLRELGARPIAGVPEGPNNPPPVDAAANDIINRIQALSEKDPNENPEEWKAELDAVMVALAEHEQLGKSFANIAELYSAIKTMHGDGKGTTEGAAAFLPESTTLETVDVLVVNESGEGKNKIVTIDGLSVKKGDGGASQLTAKVRKSGFKKVGNLSPKEVKERTIALSKKHEGIYDNDDIYNEDPPSEESVKKEMDHLEKTQKEIENDAKELGVDPKYIEYIKNKMNERKKGKPSQIESAVAGIMKIRKEQGLPVGPEIEAMMTKRMQTYYLYQAMSHRAYNQNLEVQYFGNDSFSIKKGKIDISESDGVDKIAWPRFEFNLGFSATGRSANAGGGRFQNSEFDDPSFKNWAPV